MVFDAYHTAGLNVWLQTVIIGVGSFIVFALSAILAFILVQGIDNLIFYLSIASLGCACLANALMLATLFKIFHKRTENANAQVAQATTSLIF